MPASPKNPAARQAPTRNWRHRFFLTALFFKGLDGILELAGGTFLLFVTPPTLLRWLLAALHDELQEDPTDPIANYLLHIGTQLTSNAETFAAIYLLAHGIIKLFLVINLLRGRAWAYPVAIAVLAAFILYQAYRLAHTPSPELLALTIFDILVLALIALEYRAQMRRSL